MDSAWERMIRSFRQILTSLMTERTLDDDQLHTFLLEAVSILNSRPLTPITTDADGLELLTPNHLLKLCPTANLPPSLPSNENCFPKRRWKHVQYLAVLEKMVSRIFKDNNRPPKMVQEEDQFSKTRCCSPRGRFDSSFAMASWQSYKAVPRQTRLGAPSRSKNTWF